MPPVSGRERDETGRLHLLRSGGWRGHGSSASGAAGRGRWQRAHMARSPRARRRCRMWHRIERQLDRAEFLILVMTPAALRSDNTAREWRNARQRGVCVYPVMGVPAAELDFASLPSWMSKAHFYDPDRRVGEARCSSASRLPGDARAVHGAAAASSPRYSRPRDRRGDRSAAIANTATPLWPSRRAARSRRLRQDDPCHRDLS